jgi:hypothetical protein
MLFKWSSKGALRSHAGTFAYVLWMFYNISLVSSACGVRALKLFPGKELGERQGK